VAADLAEADLVLDRLDHLDQPGDINRIGRQKVEGHPLGALGSDAGKPAELIDQVLDCAVIHGTSLSAHSGTDRVVRAWQRLDAPSAIPCDEDIAAALVESLRDLLVTEVALGSHSDGGDAVAHGRHISGLDALEGAELLCDGASTVPAGESGGMECLGRHASTVCR